MTKKILHHRSTIAAGQRYGRLLVLKEDGRHRKELRWLCRCDCGREIHVPSYRLKAGITQSCGCLFRDLLKQRNFKHGLTQTAAAAFDSWRAMMRRCYNPSARQYADYGGRGITVCERWRDPVNFVTDMGDRPARHTLDRIDPNGNYEPANCRWATRKEQQNNTRATRRFRTLDGQPISIKAMAAHLAMPISTLRGWLGVDGGAR